MTQMYLPVPGILISVEELQVPKAREVVRVLQAPTFAFAAIQECRRLEHPAAADVVVFDVEVERAQRTVYDIRHHERIAVIFRADDSVFPEILALRADFPRVPHLNLREQELPRSLCLYEEPYSEIQLRWTATEFVERIRLWLALTAQGQLHAADQPLEPLLFTASHSLVLPHDLFESERIDDPELLSFRVVSDANEHYTFIAQKPTGNTRSPEEWRYLATALISAPQEHGIIYQVPRTLRDLHDFLGRANMDLLAELRRRLKTWQRNDQLKRQFNARLILIVALPKTRTATSEVEAHDLRAFVCTRTITQIGEDIGLWEVSPGGALGTLLTIDEQRQGEHVDLILLNPSYAFSRELAASCNGLVRPDDTPITAVGVGALGSQVFSNLIHMGYGSWTLIDNDHLAPHNLARHALHGFKMGFSKATGLAELANQTLNDSKVARAIVADILQPGAMQTDVETALTEAHAILDMSASVPVARYLALDTPSTARRLSLFLNPTGTDAVLLAEDSARTICLDSLEMQYYRHLVHDSSLKQHLSHEQERLRYGQSCRDVSSTIPQDLVALHAAVGSRAVRKTLATKSAGITIWSADADTLALRATHVIPATREEYRCGDWSVCTDHQLLQTLVEARAAKLPNETGGVLIGAFDLQRKIVYVVDMIPSPPDSTEWPTSYIRGKYGLLERVQEIHQLTAGMLVYVGEWHSHPQGHGCTPSGADREAFVWLARHREMDGLPALMVIVGEHDQVGWYLQHMP